MPEKIVFLDNAETTRCDPLIIDALREYMLDKYGLPGGEFGYRLQEEALEALEKSRQIVANRINAEADEIVFTSGATESNNLAIQGIGYSKSYQGKRIITSKIEHRSVLDIIMNMSKQGFDYTFLDVDKEGIINFDQLDRSINGSRLVSVQHANQEIGTLQSLEEIGEICRSHNVVFHCDAAQSFAKESIDVKKMNVDLLSMTSHLIHGPKGVGALYVRKGVILHSLMQGDDREHGLRAGSPNVPGIVAFGLAIELMKHEDIDRIVGLRDDLMQKLLDISDSKLNGSKGRKRLCNNVNITFRYVEGEALTMHADMKGLIINTGSACYSSNLQPSHVIRAIGGTYEEAHGSTRLTLSKWTTREEIDYAVEVLQESVKKLRAFSAIAKEVKK